MLTNRDIPLRENQNANNNYSKHKTGDELNTTQIPRRLLRRGISPKYKLKYHSYVILCPIIF